MSTLNPPVSAADHHFGSDKAAVTLVEYGDYQCPHCSAVQPVIREVVKRMPGQVLFVFRHFPLSMSHPYADHAAEAAEAAGAQGKFWEMHAALLSAQDALEDADLLRRAVALELDVTRFENDLATGVHRDRVRSDFESGIRSGVNGTPAFFINGIRHNGGFHADALVAALRRAMEREVVAPH